MTATATKSNLKVLARAFGRYDRGSVIPRYEAANAGDLDGLIADKVLAETDDPVNVKMLERHPAADRLQTDTARMLEVNTLRIDLDRLKLHADGLESRNADLQKTIDGLKIELGEYVAEQSRLKGLLNDCHADNSKLKADMETATQTEKPATDPAKDKKKP